MLIANASTQFSLSIVHIALALIELQVDRPPVEAGPVVLAYDGLAVTQIYCGSTFLTDRQSSHGSAVG
jgi:hypothetical protein